MKTIKKQFRLIALLFTLLIFFQSCRVYNKDSVSLHQAVKEEKRVKIKMKNNQIYKFQRVGFENGEFYGVKRIKKGIIKVPLSAEEVKKVRLHNKPLSIIYGIGITIVGTYVIAAILFILTWGGPNIGYIQGSN